MYKVWNCDVSGGVYATIEAINKSGEYIISTVVVGKVIMIITQEPEELQEDYLVPQIDADDAKRKHAEASSDITQSDQ